MLTGRKFGFRPWTFLCVTAPNTYSSELYIARILHLLSRTKWMLISPHSAGNAPLRLVIMSTASGHVWNYKATGLVLWLTVIFGVPIRMDPMCLILGLPDGRITDSKHRRLFNILTFAARKNILLFWNKNVAPTKKSWHTTAFLVDLGHMHASFQNKKWKMRPLSFIFIFLIIFYLLYPHAHILLFFFPFLSCLSSSVCFVLWENVIKIL